LAAMATAQLTSTAVGLRNVLIATDLSRGSIDILRFGVELSRAHGVPAFIVHVVPRDEYLLAGPEAYTAASEAARREVLELKQQLLSRYSYEEGDDYQMLLAEGDVAETVLDCARQKKIDVIVLSTHGRSGISKALLGSVAERVFRHSPIPVLTLGPQVRHRTAFSPRNILVPVDFTAASQASVRYACAVAREYNAELSLLHVVSCPPGEAMADIECLKRGVERRLLDLVQGEIDERKVRARAEIGKVVPVILNSVVESDADLMVLGVHALTGLLDRLRWQVAYDLVRQASCPVLTVREKVR